MVELADAASRAGDHAKARQLRATVDRMSMTLDYERVPANMRGIEQAADLRRRLQADTAALSKAEDACAARLSGPAGDPAYRAASAARALAAYRIRRADPASGDELATAQRELAGAVKKLSELKEKAFAADPAVKAARTKVTADQDGLIALGKVNDADVSGSGARAGPEVGVNRSRRSHSRRRWRPSAGKSAAFCRMPPPAPRGGRTGRPFVDTPGPMNFCPRPSRPRPTRDGAGRARPFGAPPSRPVRLRSGCDEGARPAEPEVRHAGGFTHL